MDYDNPQFIAAVKKLLHDGLAQVSEGLKSLKDSVSAHWKADEERYQTKPVPVSDLRADVPIRVKTKAEESTAETIWRYIKGALETLGILAVVLYTCLVYESNELSKANYRIVRIGTNSQLKETMKQTELTRKNFTVDQRAWVGPMNMHISHSSAGSVFLQGNASNVGKTPATITRIHLGSKFSSGENVEPPSDPFKDAEWSSDFSGNAVIFPNQPGMDLGLAERGYSGTELNAIRSKESTLNYFGTIEYRDTFGGSHFTHFCYHYVITWAPDPREGIVVCKTWNGTDDAN
jgi:hypothetical protein